MNNKNKVRLIISSFSLKPDEICAAIGKECDVKWEVGDQRHPTVIREKDNGCIFQSNLPESKPLEQHIDKLISELKPFSEKIKSLSELNNVEFSCVIYNHTDPVNPGFHFEKNIISAIYSFGASLDIDLYVLGDDRNNIGSEKGQVNS
jgi:hypothetical protein